MRTMNNKGQVFIFFIFLLPLLVLFFVATLEFSREVFVKIKMQNVLDRGVYAGASLLAERLNKIADLNGNVHRIFLETKKDFIQRGSKRNEPEARQQLKKAMAQQNNLLSKMEEISSSAYAQAYQLTDEIVKEEFPAARLIPLHQSPLLLKEGGSEELPFSRIKGNVLDPTGHKNIPKEGFFLRLAFAKDPGQRIALAAGLELTPANPALSLLKFPEPWRAVAAAQPYGGSLWNYALHEKENFLYRTSLVPFNTIDETDHETNH